MKLCIRGHDLGAYTVEDMLHRVEALGADSVQMVCYRVFEDIPYVPGGITKEKAAAIGEAFRKAGKGIDLVGAYFNCVHSNREKAAREEAIFGEYLQHCNAMGCKYVGSETGSYNDDRWTYHPRNRTEEAHQAVAATFSRLCDVAKDHGSTVVMEGAAGHVCHDVAALQKVRSMMDRDTKVVFDLFNYLDAENQGDYLTILQQGLDTFGGDILMFHMKDCILQNGSAPRLVPFGTGELDIEAIIKTIKAYNRDAILTLEETRGDGLTHAVELIRTTWERV